MSIIKGTNQIVAGFGGTKRSIGEVYFSQSALATDNSGALPLFTGETIASANTIYPEFYNWVLAHTELQCTSAEYESALSTYGECAKYVIGGGYLRLPKKALSHGTVIKEKKPTDTDHTWYRQWSDGWLEQGGLVNVANATVTFPKPFSDAPATLLLCNTNTASAYTAKPTNITNTSFVVWQYQGYYEPCYWYACGQGADGAQEETLYPWVVAYAAAIPASTAQAAAFQGALSGKVDLPSGKTQADVDYVVDSFSDEDGNWYRKYKSGWLEQGGKTPTVAQDGEYTTTLLKPYNNVNYFVVLQRIAFTGNWTPNVNSRATTSFKIVNNSSSGGGGVLLWQACGQGE